MKIAICDNDHSFLVQIESMLEPWKEGRPDLEIETFPSGGPLVKAHVHNAFDIILLDVVLDGFGGIEIARKIRSFDKSVKLVFLASSTYYAVESYTVKASNYLLKPIDQEELLHCLNELEEETLTQARRIAFKGVRSVHCVSTSSIEYLRAHGKYVTVVLSNGSTIESNESLYSIQERLFLSDGFFKCHRSYIVNINHVTTFTAEEITMRSGQKIPISRSCKSEFKETYFSVLFRDINDRS